MHWSALTTGLGVGRIRFGHFALAVVFSLVVMYDAASVRAAGKQARVLNAIIEDLNRRQLHLSDCVSFSNPFEVLVGALLGIIVAVWRL